MSLGRKRNNMFLFDHRSFCLFFYCGLVSSLLLLALYKSVVYFLSISWQISSFATFCQVEFLFTNSFFTAVGPIFLTRRDFSELPSSPLLSVALPTLRELSLRRLVLRPSSPTLLSESVSESSSSRTVRRSLPSSPMTVVWTLSTKTTRSSSPVSVERVRLRVIFPVSDSRSSRSPVSPCLPFGSKRSRSPVLK